jgi:hypothetical protein
LIAASRFAFKVLPNELVTQDQVFTTEMREQRQHVGLAPNTLKNALDGSAAALNPSKPSKGA